MIEETSPQSGSVPGMTAIPFAALFRQEFAYKVPRETAEQNVFGLYYDVFSIFMKYGKARAGVVAQHGRDAWARVQRVMRGLLRGSSVHIGQIGVAAYFLGVELRPEIRDREEGGQSVSSSTCGTSGASEPNA